MPALNFQKQFVCAIRKGLVNDGEAVPVIGLKVGNGFPNKDAKPKRQTIRSFRKDGRDPKVGDILYLYTGMRTSSCMKLGEVKCSAVMDIEITNDGVIDKTTSFNGRYEMIQTKSGLDTFAIADGFSNWLELKNWFAKTHGLPFKGKLIKW